METRPWRAPQLLWEDPPRPRQQPGTDADDSRGQRRRAGSAREEGSRFSPRLWGLAEGSGSRNSLNSQESTRNRSLQGSARRRAPRFLPRRGGERCRANPPRSPAAPRQVRWAGVVVFLVLRHSGEQRRGREGGPRPQSGLPWWLGLFAGLRPRAHPSGGVGLSVTTCAHTLAHTRARGHQCEG